MMRRFKAKGTVLQRISNIADQLVFVKAEVAEVEEAAPSGAVLICEALGEIVEPDETVAAMTSIEILKAS